MGYVPLSTLLSRYGTSTFLYAEFRCSGLEFRCSGLLRLNPNSTSSALTQSLSKQLYFFCPVFVIYLFSVFYHFPESPFDFILIYIRTMALFFSSVGSYFYFRKLKASIRSISKLKKI